MAHDKAPKAFLPLNCAVVTVSDTRTEDNDTSGQLLADRLEAAGHKLAERVIVVDDIYQIRAVVSRLVASDAVQVILMTGGTGFTRRDNTPEAVTPLLDKEINGFGELFRQVSFQDIGTSTIQSRAIAGMANNSLIFCMPGSNNACATAWDQIIEAQINNQTRPCNFVGDLKLNLPK
ncbi:MAG: molybdenum cofactor biosynthesis protein B [Gammaproteobacteria bacterium]|nr:MAG: molybdenum cofactor biosynthesis protein B [Gammaproteobacteria bacterium]